MTPRSDQGLARLSRTPLLQGFVNVVTLFAGVVHLLADRRALLQCSVRPSVVCNVCIL